MAGETGRFFRQQVVWTTLAAMAAGIVAIPNYRSLYRWSYPLLGGAILCLVAVYFFPPVNGARRWIRLGAIGFQPSEFAKLAFILGIARYLMKDTIHRCWTNLAAALAVTLVPVVLILREPDLGTSLLFLPVLFGMLFAAGARWRDLGILTLFGLVAAVLLWTQMSREQQSRVTSLFSQAGPNDRLSSDTYQLHQGKQVAALGGVWGSLAGGGKLDELEGFHLPEAQGDFVFSVVVERIGLAGAFLLLSIYAILVWQGLATALAVREPFGRLIAIGISLLIAVQTLVNAGMAVGLLPVTGVSLPLVSYGGSGLVTYGLAIGLLINVAIRPGYELAVEPFRHATG
jgi:cell division protein FtsW (lipid II flippase)